MIAADDYLQASLVCMRSPSRSRVKYRFGFFQGTPPRHDPVALIDTNPCSAWVAPKALRREVRQRGIPVHSSILQGG